MEFESQLSQDARMPQGLGLKISHHPLTMRQVVNLVVAMERLKGTESEFSCSTEFRDEDLLNMMVESVIEERIVLELTSEPVGPIRKVRERQCKLIDRKKKNLVLVQEAMELHAVMLQGGNTDHIAYLNMSTYINPAHSTNGSPVTLGIKGTNLYLTCEMEDGKPTLLLEELEDKEQLNSINMNSKMARFVFFKGDTGVDLTKFRSAQFPDWYISTAQQSSMPVDMCQEISERYINFTVDYQS